MARKNYKDDYKPRVGADGGTEYVYEGEYFENKAGKKKAGLCFVSCILITLVYLGAGMLDTVGGRVFYVLLPYAGAALPLIYLFAGCIRLIRSGDKLTRKQYETGLPRVRRCLLALAVLIAVSLLGSAILMIVEGYTLADGIYAGLCLLILGLCISTRRFAVSL